MWKALAGFLVAGAAIAAWLYWTQQRPRPLVVSGFIEADQIRVGSRVGGRVAEVFAVEGQRLRKGDPLYRLEAFDLEERLARAEATASAAAAELTRLRAGYRPQEVQQARGRRDRLAAVLAKARAGPRRREIEIAEQKLKVAQANLELAESEHRQIMRMAQQRTASQTEIDRAERELKKSRAELAAAEQELELLREGTRPEELAEAEAALAEAEAALKLLEEGYRAEDIRQAEAKLKAAEAEAAAIRRQIAELVVCAPCECTVEAIDLRPGDIVAPDAPTVSLLEANRLWLRAYVPENRLARIRLNQRVPVRIDGFGDRKFMGRITFIATEGEFTPRNIQTPEERSKQVFRIKITIEEGLERLRSGMMGDVLLDEATPD